MSSSAPDEKQQNETPTTLCSSSDQLSKTPELDSPVTPLFSDLLSPPPSLEYSYSFVSQSSSSSASQQQLPPPPDFSSQASSSSKSQPETKADRIRKLEQELSELDKAIAVKRRDQKQRDPRYEAHIAKMHQYNEIKDIGQFLLGKLAELEETTVTEMYRKFGLDLED